MRIVVVLLIIGITAWLGVRRFIVTKDGREFAVYLVLLVLGTFITMAGMLGYDLPNPNDFLIKLFVIEGVRPSVFRI